MIWNKIWIGYWTFAVILVGCYGFYLDWPWNFALAELIYLGLLASNVVIVLRHRRKMQSK
ncbi:hypothetical protein SEA_SLOOPYJOE_83 [Arthrobacter phage Sloopyjoe]|nr:hypothetical protein PBI_SHIBA_82 [Arthrobacter phage Shiba]QFG10226.1 hypothetical protein PBI_EGAD_84 [Arthrobacter phage Egad]QFG11794.1 hypothetical protein PBI_SALK_83 [Arthrobacter phage Salk]UVT31166.1 hypothetical protein PBI_LINDA_83 [Arthrobacter phage Linda]WAB09499.1 hypothetical protein SEA_SLOOPYJOE_83 [Arthrobacter phage Sloopyjoe]